VKLPPIGFGCSSLPLRGRGRADLEGPARAALAAGYRLFDLAEVYGNERALGRALRGAQAPPRSELFVVGKVWRTNFRPAALRQACADSLRRLGLEAFDLYLLHAPEAWRHVAPLGDPEELGWEEFERRAVPRDTAGRPELDAVPLAATWEAMRELERDGLAAHIGVSNFGPAQLDELGAGRPAANEIAHSPHQPNTAWVADGRARGLQLLAHSPLSSPGLLAEPRLRELAARLGRTPAQIVLRWNLEKGLVPLPSSTDPAHIAENLRAVDLALDAAAVEAVDSLAAGAELDSAR